MPVFAFDRDGTVDTSAGPVPVAWVVALAEHHPVYAIGNQLLCKEADIPGIGHLRDRVGELDGSDADHVAYPARSMRLRMVEMLHPGAPKIHVDDVDVGADDWERWTYLSPRGFVDAVQAGELDLDVDLPRVGRPRRAGTRWSLRRR